MRNADLMRKIFRALVLIASVLLACVACDAGKVGSGVSVCISFSIQRARALGASTDFDVAEVATWKYTAHKVNGGLKTGETSEQVALTDGKSTGPLSQGIWDFEVFGYKSAGSSGESGGASAGSAGSEASGSSSAEVLVCYGKVSNVRITESEHSVSVLVAPRQVGQGSIAIGTFSLVDSSGAVVATGAGAGSVSGSGAGVAGDSSSGDASGSGVTGDSSSGDASGSGASGVTYSRSVTVYKHDDESTAVDYSGLVDSGSYKVVVSYSSADTVVGTATLYVNVYDNLTTTVSGTVEMTE